MNEDDGLDLAEEPVLGPLEDSPPPLPELGWAEAPTPQRVAGLPGGRGLIEVRRFDRLAPWDHGVPVAGDDLLRPSRRAEAWPDSGEDTRLAAHITRRGFRYLQPPVPTPERPNGMGARLRTYSSARADDGHADLFAIW